MAKTFQRLTRPGMRRLNLGDSITERGITFERLPDGDGRFTVSVMVDGQRIHRVVGRESEGTTRTQAEEFIEQLRNDAKHDRLALPKGRKVALSFREAAEKYIARLEESGGKDIRSKRRRLDLHLTPFFGSLPLSKIGSFDVERYKRQRRAEPAIKCSYEKSDPKDADGDGPKRKVVTYKNTGTNPGTINRELAVLSHLFNQAVEWGWIDRRPARIKLFKEGSGRISYLTIEQAARLVERAKQDGNEQVYPFIVIALDTSMRLMEILSIRKENIDLARRMIYVPKAKAGAREQPITKHLASFLAEHLKAFPDGSPWLFPSLGAKGGHTINIRKPFRRVVEAAGLNPNEVVRHTLRHTAITQLVQAGVDLPTIKRISGHKTLVMVERYAHANGEHIRAAMDKLDERYRQAGS